MDIKWKLWGIVVLMLALYILGFLLEGIKTSFSAIIYVLGIILFTGWFIWEGRRSGFLYIMLGKKKKE